jgi:HD superfamily phosphodiesterase
MTMNLAVKIESAENKYRPILEEYFIKTWGDTALFSHDIEHHRRVWHYGKELLSEAGKNINNIIPFSPDKLLSACYMHDLGMAIDASDRHGIHSSNLFREFIAENGLSESEFAGVLTAIRDHDKKEDISAHRSPDLIGFLTIADDLDAFGYIGISRYLEIYLLRGISPSEIGYKIRDNATKRFANFRSVFGNNAGLFEKHAIRFKILDDFFCSYNLQVKSPSFSSKNFYGNACVVELFSEMIKNHISSFNILSLPHRFSDDHIVKKFTEKLNSELTSMRTI